MPKLVSLQGLKRSREMPALALLIVAFFDSFRVGMKKGAVPVFLLILSELSSLILRSIFDSFRVNTFDNTFDSFRVSMEKGAVPVP
jgi:hypothetical protein